MTSAKTIQEFERYFDRMAEMTKAMASESYLAEEKTADFLAGLVVLSQKHQMSVAADLALVQAKAQTYTPEEGDRPNTRNGRRKKNRFLLDCLTEAKERTDQYFAVSRQLLEESGQLARKLAAVAAAKGMLTEGIPAEELAERMRQDGEMMPALTSVIGTAGYENTIYLLGQAAREVLPRKKEEDI